jgi:hypothetical protein
MDNIERRAASIFVGLLASTLAAAQVPPPGQPPGGVPGEQPFPDPGSPPGQQLPPQYQLPVQPPPLQPRQRPPVNTGPQLAGCTDSEGKLIPKSLAMNAVATATSPFSIQVTWSGPPGEYRINAAGLSAVVNLGAQLVAQPVNAPTTSPIRTARPISGSAVASTPSQSGVVNGSVVFARPEHPVLPDTGYGFDIRATLANGQLTCDGAGTKTPPAPIQTLMSSFVAPDDVRIGFVRPPFVQQLNIYRMRYVEDGRNPPVNKRVFQEVFQFQQQPLAPATFEASANGDSRKRIDPGIPPLPANFNYNQALAYDFEVEAIWSAGVATSVARAPIRVNGPMPLRGWADLHTHPMSHLAFGGKIFHGGPDAGSLLPALSIPKGRGFAGTQLEPWGCEVIPGRRATSINQALADDSSTHGDPVQSQCGDVLRKVVVTAVEMGNKANMPQPGRRSGAPVFDAWPVWNDVTHQKMWVEWIHRAYQGGLRVMVALSHNNRVLGELAKGKCDVPGKPCWLPTDDQASSDVQIMEIKEFVKRNSSFMELARNSAELYSIVSRNKLAVVLGIEIDNIGNFCPQPLPPAPHLCRKPVVSADEITAELMRLWSQDVRYIFPVHVTDNAFAGTAPYNDLFNAANFAEIGQFWQVECAGTSPYPDDEIGFRTANVTAIDELSAAIPHPFNTVIPKGVPVPRSPQNCAPGAGHRNVKGLNMTRFAKPPLGKPNVGIGEFAINEMMRLGFIIDIDHMSHRTAEDVLSMAERVEGGGYPLMSGHSAVRQRGTEFQAESLRTPAQLDRIGCLGGMFGLGTDHAEPRKWAAHYQNALSLIRSRPPRCAHKEIGLGAVALGTDVNSLVKSPKPLSDVGDPQDPDRQLNIYASVVNNAARFPESLSSMNVNNVNKSWDYRTHGVAHYGMFADFLKAVWTFPVNPQRGMQMSGKALVEDHLERNADNFWHMWVKVEQQKRKVFR